MTPLQWLRNLRRNVFPTAAEVAEDTPTLSCFVQGLIRSIETEPAKWVTSEVFDTMFTHADTDLTAHYREWFDGVPQGSVSYAGLTAVESVALGAAMFKHLVQPREAIKRAKAEATLAVQRAQIQPAMDRFARLGCPDSPSP